VERNQAALWEIEPQRYRMRGLHPYNYGVTGTRRGSSSRDRERAKEKTKRKKMVEIAKRRE